jgi:phage tail sheath protein FI
MPVQLTYPGVYVEDLPSGPPAVTGVPTAVAAFVGRTARGRDNRATDIAGYADFEQIFGGLDVNSPVSFAVRDFFLNGGQQAVVVRLFHSPTGAGAAGLTPKADLNLGTALTLRAASFGSWGQFLRGQIDFGVSAEALTAAKLNDAPWKLFNLTLRDSSPGGAVEVYTNVTTADTPRRIDRVLKAQSALALWNGPWPGDTALDSALKTALDQFNAVAKLVAAGGTDPTAVKALADARTKLAELTADPVTDAEVALDGANKYLAALLADPNSSRSDVTAARAAVADAITGLAAAKQKRAGQATDGGDLGFGDYVPDRGADNKQGIYALDNADIFNLLCLPTFTSSDPNVLTAAVAYCQQRRALLIVDPPPSPAQVDPPSAVTWKDANAALSGVTAAKNAFPGLRSNSAALYFPRVRYPNPLKNGQVEEFPPCGIVAGLYARTDAAVGVWKAPAGIETTLTGVQELAVRLTDADSGLLNPVGINCLRSFPAAGRVIWGARTLRGSDQLTDDYKYVPVRRLALYIEESLYRGTQWAVFEPNDEPLWAELRLNIGSFMHDLFRQGAFQGQTPQQAYLVKCDKETTTQSDINRGVVNVLVGFAPLKPAEFIVLQIQQLAGQLDNS